MTRYRIVQKRFSDCEGSCWQVQYRGWFLWHTVQEDIDSTSFSKDRFFTSLEDARAWCRERIEKHRLEAKILKPISKARWITTYHEP